MRERGHLESQGRGVCWHFECSLGRLQHCAVAEHRLEQHGVENLPLEEEERVQLKQPCVALSAGSFCAAWRKLSSGELVLFLGLKQAPGKRSLQGRVGVWGAGKVGTGRKGGGTTSVAEGSWKVTFSSARPPGSASSRKFARRPCFQKLTTWENWCWAKAWAVGDQGA